MYFVARNNPVISEDASEQENIGARLQKRRLEIGLTQKQAAKLLTVGEKRYSAWETGQNTIPIPDFKTICEKFELRPEYLLGIESKAEALHSDIAEFLKGTAPDLLPVAHATLKLLYDQTKARETTVGRKAE